MQFTSEIDELKFKMDWTIATIRLNPSCVNTVSEYKRLRSNLIRLMIDKKRDTREITKVCGVSRQAVFLARRERAKEKV